jgi:hypothetical protein
MLGEDMASSLIPLLVQLATAGDILVAAQDAVRAKLRDPQSATFSDMRQISGTDSVGPYNGVCGQVNAKNSYGSYVGKTPFVYVARGEKEEAMIAWNFTVELQPETDPLGYQAYRRFCEPRP